MAWLRSVTNDRAVGGIAKLPAVQLPRDTVAKADQVVIAQIGGRSWHAIPHFTSGGRIITIGSNAAERSPFPGLAAYALSKSAMLGLTRHLARELGPQGITVNLVQPGPTDTDMNPANGGELADLNRRLSALNRYASPAEVAAATVFLASPAASYMTGSVVTVDGGWNA